MEEIIDILLDEENKDPIVLVDGNGRKTAFEQIAVIPNNEKLYGVLKPINKIGNVADGEAIAFFVDGNGKRNVLKAETDEFTALKVFWQYYDLLDREIKKVERRAT